MNTVIIIIIYIIGCVLSYGRIKASFYEINEKYIKALPPEDSKEFVLFIWMVALLSWIGFIAGFIMYLQGDKYFLKWNYKSLKKMYDER